MTTPKELNISRGTIVAPTAGWKAQSYYSVDVAYSSTNVIHRVIFYTGFLNKQGNPSGYNCLLSPSNTIGNHTINDVYYLKVVNELDLLSESDV